MSYTHCGVFGVSKIQIQKQITTCCRFVMHVKTVICYQLHGFCIILLSYKFNDAVNTNWLFRDVIYKHIGRMHIF